MAVNCRRRRPRNGEVRRFGLALVLPILFPMVLSSIFLVKIHYLLNFFIFMETGRVYIDFTKIMVMFPYVSLADWVADGSCINEDRSYASPESFRLATKVHIICYKKKIHIIKNLERFGAKKTDS